jgi:hypothetical protein
VVPESWRVRAMRDSDIARVLLQERPNVALLDWESTRIKGPEGLVVPAFDLSVAEFLVKLPAQVRVAAVDLVLTPRLQRLKGGGVEAMIQRARARCSLLSKPTVSHDRFAWAIDSLVRQASALVLSSPQSAEHAP